ncbi:MAG: PD-(D/E)XK nuclease family protein [Deltaproteobacteria bacterium]
MKYAARISGVEFLCGSDRADLDARVLDLLAARIDESGIPRFLYLSPTKRKNREMAARLRNRRISWRPHLYVPLELAETLIEARPDRDAAWIGEELKILIILDILEHERAEGDLPTLRFSDFRTPLGVARHVARALERLCRRGLTPLESAAGLPGPVAEDLEFVLKQYRERLDKLGLSDPCEIPALAAESLSRKTARVPPTCDLLVLDGFAAPEKVEADFLCELARAFEGKEVVVTIPSEVALELSARGWDHLSPDLRIFSHGKDFFARLGLTGRDEGVPAAEVRSSRSAEGRRFIVREYPDRAVEVKAIAREIKRLFFDEPGSDNLTPEDFHVVVPRIDHYYRLFMELFPRYGVPFNITRGIPLSSIPVVGLIAALLDAVIARDHTALVRFFSSELVTAPPSQSPDDFASFVRANADLVARVLPVSECLNREMPEPVALDISMLDRVCREAAVRGGADPVRDWIGPTCAYFESQILQARMEDEPELEPLLRDKFREIFIQLWLLAREFNAFDRLAGERPVGELLREVEALVDRYLVKENLVDSLIAVSSEIAPGGRIIFEKNVKGFDRALSVMADIGSDLRLVGNQRVSMDRIRDMFRDRCRREMIQEAGELAGVSVSEMLELRNLTRSVTFMAGLTSDAFPVIPSSNFLLPQGPDSQDFARAMDESRFIFSQAIENSGKIFFSYPTSDGEEPLEPSPFLEDIIHRGEAEEPPEERDPEEPFCRFEILQAIGRLWHEGEALPWEHVRRLVAQYPAKSDDAVSRFHEEIRRALSTSLLQTRLDEHGPYDGMIRDAQVMQSIGRMLDDRAFVYSVSMLNDYQRCPLEFFFKRVLAIAPVKEIPEEPEAAEVGTAVHSILARFYEARRRAGLGRITRANRLEALAGMLQSARDVLDAHHFLGRDRMDSWVVRRNITDGLYDSPSLASGSLREQVEQGADMPRYKRGMLRMLADYEAESDRPLDPWLTEFAFGFDNNPPLLISGQEGRVIRVRGRIDRIDVYGSQADAASGTAWIFDYKTGRVPAMKDVQERRDLQLPVYLLAVLGDLTGTSVSGAGACFLSLRSKEEDPASNVIHTEGLPADAVPMTRRKVWQVTRDDLEGFRHTIKEIDSSIRQGRFPRSPDPAPCERCGFRMACFRDEMRVRLLSRG